MKNLSSRSPVSQIPAAPSHLALAHFEARLTFEADCWDTHASMKACRETEKAMDFILIDVRSPSMYKTSHIPGAVNLPHGKMIKRHMDNWPKGTLFVVYCAGPHCNGANKAAIRLAALGRPVKELIGGMTGWADEGFDFAHVNQ